jgi:hypothetical protein
VYLVGYNKIVYQIMHRMNNSNKNPLSFKNASTSCLGFAREGVKRYFLTSNVSAGNTRQ